MLASYGTIGNADNTLRAFRDLAEEGMAPVGESLGHKDGWGIVCYAKGMPKELGRQPSNAMADDLYVNALDEAVRLRPSILIAHLRKASPGIEISLENTQPLQNGSWSFAHNGTIWSHSFRLGGHSDSIIFFEKLLENVQRRSDSDTLTQRILEAVAQLRKAILDNPDSKGRTYTSITFILSDGNSMWVLRDCNDDRDKDYYTMHYLHSENYILFCQQKIIPGKWESIENKTMAIVNPDNELNIVECL